MVAKNYFVAMELQFEFQQIMGLTQSGKNEHKHFRFLEGGGDVTMCAYTKCVFYVRIFVIGLLQ